MGHLLAFHLMANVSATPNVKDLPGSNVLQKLIDGADGWALALSLLSTFIGAAVWAIASHTNNHHYAGRGRMSALVGAAAALIIGAGPTLVNFFAGLGASAR